MWLVLVNDNFQVELIESLMNDNAHAEANVVLSSAWQYQRASNRSWKLLIAAANEVQVNFSGANVKPVVESNVHSPADG